MKKQSFLNYLFAGLVALVVGTLAVVIFAATRSPAKTIQVKPPDERTLRDRAKLERHVIKLEAQAQSRTYADLADLANHSTVVIIGTPVANLSKITPDGKSATIDYQIKVEYVYKGAMREGDLVKVSLPGGMIRFENGSTAEVRTPWFRKMLNGQTYALFLTPSTSGNFLTTGGAEGVFDIPTSATSRLVNTHAATVNDPMSKYHNLDVRIFLADMRRVTGKRKV